MKRQFDPATPELMDRPQARTAELERDLHNLRQLNKWLGGYEIVRDSLRRWIQPHDEFRVLDLATGSGDIPRLVADFGRRNGCKLKIDAIDMQAATLEIAQSLSTNYPEISFHEGNALEWGEDDAYDIVLCSLALHHFSEESAIQLLRRCKSLSRRYVLVADLRRGFLASVGVYLLTAIVFREPMTKYDGRASAARAFSFSEMRRLAEAAGWENFAHEKCRYARQAIRLEQ